MDSRNTAREKRAKWSRAWIRDDEELQICDYALEFRHMPRTKLAEKIEAEVKWPGKPPEIEVLERKISYYRRHARDLPEDEPWSMATLDKHPIHLGAVPAVLESWKESIRTGDVFTIRESKWVSRLHALMASEVRRTYVWRHGTKWLESETYGESDGRQKSNGRQSSHDSEGASDGLSLRIAESDEGAMECPRCGAQIGIGPTTETAVCVGCDARFSIIRTPVGDDLSEKVRRETSVVKTIPPVIRSIRSLVHYAKGYARLELIYDLIGQPFDSTYMDMRIAGVSRIMPDFDDHASLLPYIASNIEAFKTFRDTIRRSTDERSHREKR